MEEISHSFGNWNNLIEEFRRLGGVADNVRVGVGPRGRGLFAEDPAKECRIVVPGHLIIDVADVEIRNSQLVVKSGARVDRAVASFYERFQEQFAFGAGSFEDCMRVLEARHSLPPEVQVHLRAGEPLLPYASLSQASKLQYFLSTRAIEDRNLMPVLELANHSSEYSTYKKTKDGGYQIAGNFEDEILVSYTSTDTWRIFALFGFSCTTPLALAHPGARQLHRLTLGIGMDIKKNNKIQGVRAPLVARSGDVIVLSYLELGNRLDPSQPRRLFNCMMESCNVPDSDILFDAIADTNTNWFQRLLELLEGHTGTFISELRKAAQTQLQTLSCHKRN